MLIQTKNTLGLLTKRFSLPEEFPLQDRAVEALDAMRSALSASETELEYYASTLTGRELDNLLYSLIVKPEKRVLQLLAIRFTGRTAAYLWALFQYHADCSALLELISIAKPSYDMLRENGGRLMLAKGFLNNPADIVTKVMLSECGSIEAFIDRYGLIRGSPFCELVKCFFYSRCDPNVLEANFEPFTEYIVALESLGSSPALRHYLSSIKPEQYHIPLNLYLVERLGIPSAVSENWSVFPEQLTNKLGEWYKMHMLAGLLKKPGFKYDLLVAYLKTINEILYDKENGVLRLNLGSVSLFDPNPKEDTAFLFTDAAKGMSITKEEFSTIKQLPDARNHLIEEAKSDIYKLEFFEFGKLYTREILDKFTMND